MLDSIILVVIGLGLAATCGFRIFVPPLVLGLAANAGYLTLPESMEWISSTPALIVLGTAAVLEIGAYYIPWLDNLLDTVSSPVAIIAGVLLSAGMIEEVHPVLQWAIAILAGGGLAATVQFSTVALRGTSTGTTGGVGNPIVSTGEVAAASVFSLLIVLLPLLGFALLIGFITWVMMKISARIGGNRENLDRNESPRNLP